MAKNFDLFGLGDAARAPFVSEAVNNYASSEVVNPPRWCSTSAPSPASCRPPPRSTPACSPRPPWTATSPPTAPATAPTSSAAGPFVVGLEKVGAEVVLTNGSGHHLGTSAVGQPGARLPRRDPLRGHPRVRRPRRSPDQRVKPTSPGRSPPPTRRSCRRPGRTCWRPRPRGVNNSFSLRFRNATLSDLRVWQALALGTTAKKSSTPCSPTTTPATSVIGKTALATRTCRRN